MSHEKFQSCIEACIECATTCSHCATACLTEQDVKMLARCIKLDLECAAICRAAMELMSLGGEHAHALCAICADICDACAAECEKHSDLEHCQKCAEACKRCAEECRSMAKVRCGDDAPQLKRQFCLDASDNTTPAGLLEKCLPGLCWF